MNALQDKIHGREGATGVRKGQGLLGRAGDTNPRKSVSSASGSNAGTGMSVASRFLGSLSSRGAGTSSDRSTRTRRWSSASDDFSAVTSSPQEVGEPDRADLYTVSSRSTGTTESGVLSDIPSFISEYTFKTSSNPGSKSRPSVMSSNASQLSTQSDWLRMRRSYSSESLPETISERGEAIGTMAAAENSPVPSNPLSSNAPRSLLRRRRGTAPFDEPQDAAASGNDHHQQTAGSRSPRKFRMFRRATPSIESQLSPPPTYPPRSRLGRSSESLNTRDASASVANSTTSRRNSNPVSRQMLLRVGSHGDNFVHLMDIYPPPVRRTAAHPSSQNSQASSLGE